jgi:hypothetical protein
MFDSTVAWMADAPIGKEKHFEQTPVLIINRSGFEV